MSAKVCEDLTVTELHGTSPEGALIEAARKQAHVSMREAARRAGFSEGWWRQIVGGTHAPAATIAKMALAVGGIEPERMTTEGRRPDAAEEMQRELAEAGLPDDDEGITLTPPGMSPAFEAEYLLEYQALGARIHARDRAEADEAREQRRKPRRLTGEDYFPLHPADQRSWNDLISRGLSRKSVISILATVHVRLADEAQQQDGATGLRLVHSHSP
jgi:transcriptional regulator with XRE-family HTH domain